MKQTNRIAVLTSPQSQQRRQDAAEKFAKLRASKSLASVGSGVAVGNGSGGGKDSKATAASKQLAQKKLQEFKNRQATRGAKETRQDAATKTSGSQKLLAAPLHRPYAGGFIRSFVTAKEEVYYRVYSGDSRVGSFLTKTPPSSSLDARNRLALPPENKAEKIQIVIVPPGTRMIRSRALPNFGSRGGGEQFQLIDKIPEENFGLGKDFK